MQVEIIDKGDNVCYVLLSKSRRRTYCGFTNAFWQRRILQHNGEKSGGAKYTRVDRPWSPLFIVKGFRTKSEALCFEWAMKHSPVSSYGIRGKVKCLNYVINKERWTGKCDLAKDVPLKVVWYSRYAYDLAATLVDKPDQVDYAFDFSRE